MAARWQDVATQQAEFISTHLRELLSSGLGLLHSEFGVDLGLKPELYPSWVILLTASLGLLVIVVLWAAACSGVFGGKRRPGGITEESNENPKATVTKIVKPDDQRKKNKKKPVEKKPQPNGRTVVELHETEENLKPAKETKTEKAKNNNNNKKKQKAEVKQAKAASLPDGREHDEGAWETKVSNREKRQQRRKDKAASDDSGSPGGVDPPASTPVEQLKGPSAVPVVVKKSKGEPLRAKAVRGDAVKSQASTSWSETPSVNGRGWSGSEGENLGQLLKVATRRNPDAPAWVSETDGTGGGSWSVVDGRMKKSDLTPASHAALVVNSAAAEPQPVADKQLDRKPKVDDEWSDLNGMSADPGSDWNAPAEPWGNYEEPQLESPTPPEEPVSEVVKGSDDDKEKGDSASTGSGKTKKKKKKKKKQGDDGGALQESDEPEKEGVAEELRRPAQEAVPPIQADSPVVEVRAERPPAAQENISRKPPPAQAPQQLAEPESTAKQNSAPVPSQKKSEENWESSKQVKKKKARRET